MSASFRLVHYIPDPISDERFALGAVVSVGAQVHGVASQHLPGPSCLGGASHAGLAAFLVRQLEEIMSLDEINRLFGPNVRVSQPQSLPASVSDPTAWVKEHVLRQPLAAQRAPRGHNLPTQGFQFFTTWGVARHVRKTFRADTDGIRWLRGRGRGLQPITHWVSGADGLLLMEPVAPGRNKLQDDLQTLATRMQAWRSVLHPSAEPPVPARLVVYMLTGGPPKSRAQVCDWLGDKADLIVDTDHADARDALLAEVTRYGQTGAQQTQMPN